MSSDGSYKDGVSAFIYRINQDHRELSMIGGNKCDSHTLMLSSFDTEAYGEITLTYKLLRIIPNNSCRPHMNFTSFVDNKKVINT